MEIFIAFIVHYFLSGVPIFAILSCALNCCLVELSTGHEEFFGTDIPVDHQVTLKRFVTEDLQVIVAGDFCCKYRIVTY